MGGNDILPVILAAARQRQDVIASQQFRALLAATIATEVAVALEKQVVVERWRLRFPPARVASAQGQDAADTQAGAFAGEA